MPEMTPLEVAKKLEEWAQVSKDFDDYEGYVCSTAAASYLREIANGEYKQVVHARWVNHHDGSYTCTGCKSRVSASAYGYPHCPLCGAKMNGKDDSYGID